MSKKTKDTLKSVGTHVLIYAVLLITLFCFAIIGTVIKTIVDRFNMQNSYEDYLQEAGGFTDDGDLMEK